VGAGSVACGEVSPETIEHNRDKRLGEDGVCQAWKTWDLRPTAQGWGMGIGEHADPLGAFPAHPQPASFRLSDFRGKHTVLKGHLPLPFPGTPRQFSGLGNEP
jgi:hypothetical protein